MRLSADISLYPLADDFEPAIRAYIRRLQERPDIEVVCNTLSTQIFGEAEAVWRALEEVSNASFEAFGRQVLVIKLLPGDRHPDRTNDR